MEEAKSSDEHEQRGDTKQQGWAIVNQIIRNARNAKKNEKRRTQDVVYYLICVPLIIIIVALLLAPSLFEGAPHPTSQILMAVYQTVFGVTATTAAILAAIFVFVAGNAQVPYLFSSKQSVCLVCL